MFIKKIFSVDNFLSDYILYYLFIIINFFIYNLLYIFIFYILLKIFKNI